MLRSPGKLLLAMSVIALAMSTVAPSVAHAHFLGRDAVDGREIRWSDTTKYDDARSHSISTWNGLNPINILADTSSTINDLRFSNFYASSASYDGRYLTQIGEDVIDFNDYFFDGYSDTKRRGVATHELGHALGLAHSYSGQVMVDNTPARGSITTPQSHDTADYHALWGY